MIPPTATELASFDQAIERLHTYRISEYRRFDQELRKQTSLETPWIREFRTIQPFDVERLVRHSADPVVAAAIVSCHWNGFVREEGVRWLGTFTNRHSVGMLLVRAADWVQPVADMAATTLRYMWPLVSDADRIACLPLLEQISIQGSRLSNIALELTIDQTIDPSALLDALRNPESDIRRFSARRLSTSLSLAELTEYAVSQTDPVAALTLGRAALAHPSFGEHEAFALLRCRVGSVRGAALVRLVQAGASSLVTALHLCLFDQDSVVRSYAQHQMSVSGTDLRAYYLAALARDERNALLAFSDVATAADAPVGYQYLRAERPRTRYLACRILQRVTHPEPVPELFEMVAQDCASNARVALRVLARSSDPQTQRRLWQIAEQTSNSGRQTIICSGLQAGGGWEPLAQALEALAAGSNRFAQLLIERTLATWGRSFTSPTKEQTERIRRSLFAGSDRLPADTRAQLHDSIRHYVKA
jgi:hypothetical protein